MIENVGKAMDHCAHCRKRMKPVFNPQGRTEFGCMQCDKISGDQVDVFERDAQTKRVARTIAGRVLPNGEKVYPRSP